MSTTATHKRYRELRATRPFLRATDALAWAKTADASKPWESTRDDNWTREVDGFTVTLRVVEDSIFPKPNRSGETDYGRYVDEVDGYRYGYDNWQGNHAAPAEFPPLGLPYTSIRYDGPGWVQGEKGGYFIPDGIEATFADFRAKGQSRAVAWDLTREDVEAQISMLFHSPLTNVVVHVEVSRDGVELGSASMGTDVSGDDDGRAYIFQMVEEYDLIAEAIDEAAEALEKLTKFQNEREATT